jgi:hypothetical protein
LGPCDVLQELLELSLELQNQNTNLHRSDVKVTALVQIFADRMPLEIITIAALQLLNILALRRFSFIK